MKKRVHKRQIYDSLALIGDVGATVGVLEIIAAYFLAPVAQHIFLLRAIQKMFMAKTSDETIFDRGNKSMSSKKKKLDQSLKKISKKIKKRHRLQKL